MMSEIKDRPLVMPCDDPEGCKHFKAIVQLQAELQKLKQGYIRHKESCHMGQYNSILIGKGCTCGLSDILKDR